jgi:NhaP-type Na+/H+ or K+/H+ antiporter
MDAYIINLLITGLLLLLVTSGSGWIARLPLSHALIYLLVGISLGSYGLNLIQLRPNAEFIERFTEFGVIVSLFGCGLKMNRPLQFWQWQTTARLIGLLMPISIGAIALVGHWLLQMDWGAAILLGAILAPTDPVLASEVQLGNPEDQDELRFGLTSEGGFNDALAFPFVYFGLHALEDSNWDNWLRDWLLVDLVWAIAFAVVTGLIVAKGVVWLNHQIQRKRPAEAGFKDFLTLSTILLAYSVTEIVNGYGFLAVFVAGYFTQSFYYTEQEKRHEELEFTKQIEKLLEVGIIILLGTLLLLKPVITYAGQALLIVTLLFLVIRPLGTWLSLLGSHLPFQTRLLLGWFGIRGVGSLYYLAYAFGYGLEGEIGEQVAWITYMTVILSIIIHGISATPLMSWYEHQTTKS